ncbi:eukaryotic translation initiation factor 2-alpha kinase 1-like isoform X2 [Frieseomelitta varia]|uniref:eukaryotic translation initiation factor 2-alpha kinase 1-like isoform X2 n=1 Tax=Frieseomelitta varia TaxID=561572 RepID=UPI001CB695C0|nr:eukaryotic translation initiation factor 2-alpha kinase 1-like isoform X2 [Frieseomelitta varia]
MSNNNTFLTNPWDALCTATTFDKGNDAKSTICLENENNQNDRQIVSIVTTTSSLLIESLVKQLCILFEDDSVCRNELYFAICSKLHELKLIDGSYNVMELESLRSEYQQALYHLFTVIRGTISCKNILQISSSLYKSSVAEWSRYHREFQEISFIAAGGFGNVFKALHRLDGIEYAIKKIKVPSDRVKNIMQHLEEVKTFAKLNHTNIVSYKGAWIEPRLPSIFMQNLISSNHFQSKLNSIEYNERSGHKSYVNRTSSSQSQQSSDTGSSRSSKENGKENMLLQHSKQINCKSEEESEEKNSSNSISFRNDSKLESNKTKSNTNYTDGSNSYEESNKNKIVLPYILRTNEKYTTLYIQMALCEKTLQQWLDERMEITPQTIIAILTQILHGLDYIHSRGIVHHDIKPSNIFISTSERLQIQLGDFGLACLLRSKNHHSIIGTRMYAAPEQLQGKCDPKSDIYSVGIVLLELLIHTRTHMERIEIINSLKRGHIPTTLAATHPKWAYIVSQLIQEDPRKRPSTNQLLQDLNEDKDMMIVRLKNDIIEKDDVIKNLQERILILEEQIVKHNI